MPPGSSILPGGAATPPAPPRTASSSELPPPLLTRPPSPGCQGRARPVRPSRVRTHPADCAPAPGASASAPRNELATARLREHHHGARGPLPQWPPRVGEKKPHSERGGSGRAGRRVPEATGGARIAGRAHRGPHSACRLTRPAPSGPRCHRPGRPSSGGQSVHPSVTLTGRPGDDEDRSLGRPAGLRSSNFRLPGAVASNNSPAEGTTAPARRPRLLKEPNGRRQINPEARSRKLRVRSRPRGPREARLSTPSLSDSGGEGGVK